MTAKRSRPRTEAELETHIAQDKAFFDSPLTLKPIHQDILALIVGLQPESEAATAVNPHSNHVRSLVMDLDEDKDFIPNDNIEHVYIGGKPYVTGLTRNSNILEQQRINECLHAVDEEEQYFLRRNFVKSNDLQSFVVGHYGISPPSGLKSSVSDPSLSGISTIIPLSEGTEQEFLNDFNSSLQKRPSRNYTREYSPVEDLTPVMVYVPINQEASSSFPKDGKRKYTYTGNENPASLNEEASSRVEARPRTRTNAGSAAMQSILSPRYGWRNTESRQRRHRLHKTESRPRKMLRQ